MFVLHERDLECCTARVRSSGDVGLHNDAQQVFSEEMLARMDALHCVYVTAAWLCPTCSMLNNQHIIIARGAVLCGSCSCRCDLICLVRERFLVIRFEGDSWYEHVHSVRFFDGCCSLRFCFIGGGSWRFAVVRGGSLLVAV